MEFKLMRSVNPIIKNGYSLGINPDTLPVRNPALSFPNTVDKPTYVFEELIVTDELYVEDGRKRKPMKGEHKRKMIETKKANYVPKNHSQETKNKQGGKEYYDPISLKTKRIKVHLGEPIPDGWIKGRFLEKKKWINDGVKAIKIAIEQSILLDGYCLGRIDNQRDEFGRFNKKTKKVDML